MLEVYGFYSLKLKIALLDAVAKYDIRLNCGLSRATSIQFPLILCQILTPPDRRESYTKSDKQSPNSSLKKLVVGSLTEIFNSLGATSTR